MKKVLISLFLMLTISCSITDFTIHTAYNMANNGIMSKDNILDLAVGISKIQKKYLTDKNFTLSAKKYKGVRYFSYKKADSENVVVLVHGGAFKLPFNQLYVGLATEMAKYSKSNFEILLLDYKTDVKYPSQSLELETLLEYVNLKYKKVILFGDSSGANVVLSVSQKIRDEGRKISDGLIVLSPWADLTNTVSSRKNNYYKDILFGSEDYPDAMIKNKYVSEVKDLTNPYVSPVFGIYDKFPKTLIQIGENELLFDDSKILYEKMKKADVDVEYTVYKKMFHVFQLLPFLPETKAAYTQIGKFIDTVF